nr:SpoIVB peptidase S55 domain-containing protein [bacterium]
MRNSNGILIKFNFFFLSIFIIYAIVLPENIFSFETLPVSEIKAGMKGYGLSVFKGVEPEKFNVEVVSVLKNEAPQRDLILVKCGGCELEKSKIIAGMSGSPVYINKKLIGAIAYAWSFSMEPLGLVTPISYMLEECENPVDYTEYPDAVNLNDGQKNLSLIKIPLMMRGASEKFLANDSSFFSKTNFIPVEFSGAGEWNIPAAYKPGAAIALQLITGDWDISAIGTITAISDSGKILAFGHPFLGLGKTSFPAATAGIHTVMKSYLASWKIGSPIKTEGSLVQDRNSLIVVDPKITAHTIKTRISYLLPKSKEKKEFNLNIASNKFLTPYLLNSSINYSGQISINAIGPKLSYIQHFKIKFNDNKYLEYNS